MMARWLNMKVIDRYLVRTFLRTFGFSVLIFSMISVAIDFSDKVQNFVDKKPPLRAILIDYYACFVVHIANLILPLYVLIAVVFFTSRLASNSEIISMLNAGMSFRRLLKPYLLGAGVIVVLQLIASHIVVPLANKRRLHFEDVYVSKQVNVRQTASQFMISPNEQVSVSSYDHGSKSIRNFRLERFNGSEIREIIEATDAVWNDTTKAWQLSNYIQRSFNGLEETIKLGGSAKIDTVINLQPSDFEWAINENQEMTTPQLIRASNRIKQRGSGNARFFETEIHRRTADACTILILTIIGLALSGRKVRGGIGLHLTLAIGIGALFILFSKFSVTLGSNGIVAPWLSVWIPNLIFGSVAAVLSYTAQK